MAARNGRAPGVRLFAAKADIWFDHTLLRMPEHGGELIDEHDPLYKRNPSAFEEWVPKVRKYQGQRVEQATAAPGEARK